MRRARCGLESSNARNSAKPKTQNAGLKIAPWQNASSSYSCAVDSRVCAFHGKSRRNGPFDSSSCDRTGPPSKPDSTQTRPYFLFVDARCFYTRLRLGGRSVWYAGCFSSGDSNLCAGFSSLRFRRLYTGADGTGDRTTCRRFYHDLFHLALDFLDQFADGCAWDSTRYTIHPERSRRDSQSV